MESLQLWWEELKINGNTSYVFHTKLKHLKQRHKQWVSGNLGKIERKIALLEGVILGFKCDEEER